jgi:hypothetical protein
MSDPSETPIAMDERVKKSFDFAADLTRQLITLSTAIIAAVIAFFDKTGSAKNLASWELKAVLGLYLVSVIFGLIMLMALTGNLTRLSKPASIYARNITFFSILQILTFLSATMWIIFLLT